MTAALTTQRPDVLLDIHSDERKSISSVPNVADLL